MMLPDQLLRCDPGPLDQMRACANLMAILRDCIAEERILRRNGVRITPQMCLEVMTELQLVARTVDPDLARELWAAHDRFADTRTTIGRRRAPNPAVGQSLSMALGVVAQVIEALSMTLLVRHPDQMTQGRQIIDRLRAGTDDLAMMTL